jgi:hypothetical protein
MRRAADQSHAYTTSHLMDAGKGKANRIAHRRESHLPSAGQWGACEHTEAGAALTKRAARRPCVLGRHIDRSSDGHDQGLGRRRKGSRPLLAPVTMPIPPVNTGQDATKFEASQTLGASRPIHGLADKAGPPRPVAAVINHNPSNCTFKLLLMPPPLTPHPRGLRKRIHFH